jgi:methionine-rich copper-binding protein CopC
MKALHTMILATAMVSATLAAPFASAHARLKSSNPQAGATLVAAPKEITLTFNEKVEAAFSTITLTDAGGKAVAAGKAKVDETNPAILRLEAPALSAGSYTVTWAVAGHDGHRRKGDFKFTVK